MPTLKSGLFVVYNTSSSGTGAAWFTIDNIKQSDDLYAQSTAIASQTKFLIAYFSGLTTIPTNISSFGIKLFVEKRVSDSAFYDYARDFSVRLISSGYLSGDDKASSSNWPFEFDTVTSYGDTTDTWNSNLTPEHFNSLGNFGCAIAAESNGDSVPFYVDHIYAAVYYDDSASIPLVTKGYDKQSGNIPLFSSGFNKSSGNLGLYIDGYYPTTSIFDGHRRVRQHLPPILLLWSETQDTTTPSIDNYINLYTKGIDNSSGYFSLYSYGFSDYSGSLHLYAYGSLVNSGNILLHTHGVSSESGSIPLHTYSTLFYSGNIPLYTYGSLVASSSIPLVLSGVNAYNILQDISLHTIGISPSGHITLFAGAKGISYDSMNLSLKGALPSTQNTIPLILWNDFPVSSIPLFVKGKSNAILDDTSPTLPGVPVDAHMNLIIGQGIPIDNSINLYCRTIEGIPSGTISLFTTSAYNYSGLVNLSIPSTVNSFTSTIRLYTNGF